VGLGVCGCGCRCVSGCGCVCVYRKYVSSEDCMVTKTMLDGLLTSVKKHV
jgi:hypothetical protein